MEKLLTYEEVFTFENLYKAHLASRRCKRHKKEVIAFETHVGESLSKLHRKLMRRFYKISSYDHFVIHEPKERNIQSLSYEDRVVQHCLVDNYLMPLLERMIIYDNGACRKDKGVDFSRDRVKSFLVKHIKSYGLDGYVLQFDIHAYFQSIDHEILKEKLSRIVEDKDILNLLHMIVDSYLEGGKEVGLPMGNQTSQCFALLYLDSLDRMIKERHRIKFYSRYMDDGILISSDKEELRKILHDIRKECESLRIELNPKKTKITKLKHGFRFLGFKYRFTDTGKILMTFPKDKKRRMVRFLRKKKRDGFDTKTTIDSIEEHSKRGNEYEFIQRLRNEFEEGNPNKIEDSSKTNDSSIHKTNLRKSKF